VNFWWLEIMSRLKQSMPVVVFFALRKTRRRAQRQATESVAHLKAFTPQSGCCAVKSGRSATEPTNAFVDFSRPAIQQSSRSFLKI
jgi:hypothetical protein